MSTSLLKIFSSVMVALAACTQALAWGTTNEQVLGFSSDLEGDTTRISDLREKPATFDSFSDRMDFIHDNLQLSLQQHVVMVDTMMLSNKNERIETPPSRFRLAPFVTIKQDSKTEFSIDPSFDMEIDLPNLEREWKVFLQSSRDDELPGVDRNEREQSSQIGLRSVRKYIRTDVGIKLRWPPVVFARAEWRPRWSYGHTAIQPKQRIFVESGQGIGSLTSLTIHRWFGANNNMFWQSVSAARYASEGTDGVEMEQSLKLALVRKTLESKWTWRTVMGADDMARGHLLRYSLFARANAGNEQIERHRITYTYRKPIYKKWIYLEVAPGVEFRNDNNWDPVPQITVGADMLFWGSYER